MNRWGYRFAALLAAGLLAAVAREIAGLGDIVGRGSSPLKLATFALALAGAAGGLALALAPAAAWTWIEKQIRFLPRLPDPITTPPGRRTVFFVFLAAGATYLGLVAIAWRNNPQPTDDQIAYLQTAAEIHAAGGPVALLRQLFSGEFTEANRHPLYLGLLSLRPTFAFGKGLSLAIGAVAWGMLSWLAARRFGVLTGAIFSTLMATNHAYCRLTSHVVSEGLLVAGIGAAWYAGTADPADRTTRSYLARQLGTGALWGLAYLTKGTAVVFFAGYLAWLIVMAVGVRRTAQARSIWLGMVVCVLGCLVVASPLLVRNARRFGNPLYNVNSYLLFVDRYEDLHALAQRRTLAEVRREYFRTHGWTDILDREISGIVWETFIVVRQLGPMPLEESRVLLGTAWLALSIAAVWRYRRHALLMASWLAISVLVFAWYVPIAAGERFVLPLIVPLLTFTADGLVRLLTPRAAGHIDRHTTAIIGGSCLWCGVWLAASWLWV